METKTIYQQDFGLWIAKTVKYLRAGNYQKVDWEHLIEEVETLVKSDQRKVKSCLRQLLTHLLKLYYLPLPQEFHHWEIEIRNFRIELQDIFEDSPSLKRYANEVLPSCWQTALEGARQDYSGFNFPAQCPFPVEIDQLMALTIRE
ncbi:MAG: DUF29 domain-containing protein [Symploca sp. SIO2G7]|nr:DUF29 domain-containing protein [Symploca sp. SIO2G7]